MRKRNTGFLFLLMILAAISSCSVSNKSYDPHKKYPRTQLQQDYLLLKNILVKEHPSLYWYTPKDSMDNYFKKYYDAIEDSMTELQFGWKILAPLTAKIKCGHTSFSMSKAYTKWVKNKRYASFPLYLKVWNDTMVVTANLNKKDSIFKRGVIVKSINGRSGNELVKYFFSYMPTDGQANNINYIRLSSNFPYYYRNIIGNTKTYTIEYIDSLNMLQSTTIPVYDPPKDSAGKKTEAIKTSQGSKRQRKKEKLLRLRSLQLDKNNHTAVIALNTFSAGKLRKFFRRSFKTIRKEKIQHVVLDLRINGGGNISLSTLLTRYVTRKSFGIADSCYARVKSLQPYTKYIKNKNLNGLALFFSTKKQKDKLYHFTHWEQKQYTAKKSNHYNQHLYVLTSGSTFSAATLFCNVMKGQPNVLLVGEETGGGWHGNNGILIPDIILPNTHLRVRLPLFRLVQYNHVLQDGSGIKPDIYVGTDYEALKQGEDKKMRIVMELIKSDQAASQADSKPH